MRTGLGGELDSELSSSNLLWSLNQCRVWGKTLGGKVSILQSRSHGADLNKLQLLTGKWSGKKVCHTAAAKETVVEDPTPGFMAESRDNPLPLSS